MNFKFYTEKLKNSQEYKNFIKDNPKAYFSGGFLAIDIENNGIGDEQHLDYYDKGKKEYTSFCISKSCQKSLVELKDKEKIPEEVNENVDFDIDKIKVMIQNEIAKQGMKNKIQKILLSLQAKNKKHYLIGTVFITKLGLIKLQISLEDMIINEFEKKSILDMVKRVK